MPITLPNPFAGRAGTQWGIEGKHVVGWFLEGDAVGFEPGREIVADIAWQEEETAGTVALIESSLGRIDEAADVVLLIAYRSTVDDEEDILRLGIALEVVDADEFTFHQNACVSLLEDTSPVAFPGFCLLRYVEGQGLQTWCPWKTVGCRQAHPR